MRLIILLLLACFSVSAATVAAPDDEASRMAAGRRYLEVSDIAKMLADSVEATTQSLPAESRERFRKLISDHVRIDVLNEAMLMVMVRTFTTDELNALADFYGSPVGKSIISKFDKYMTEIMPLMEAELQHAIEEARAAEKKGSKSTS